MIPSQLLFLALLVGSVVVEIARLEQLVLVLVLMIEADSMLLLEALQSCFPSSTRPMPFVVPALLAVGLGRIIESFVASRVGVDLGLQIVRPRSSSMMELAHFVSSASYMPAPLCPSQDPWKTYPSILPSAPVSLSSLVGGCSAHGQYSVMVFLALNCTHPVTR